MFVIPAAIIAIIYLLLKVFVPIILLISLIVLLYFYCKNREEADEKIENAKEKINTAKEKASSMWEKTKFIFDFLKKKDKNKDDKEQELNDI